MAFHAVMLCDFTNMFAGFLLQNVFLKIMNIFVFFVFNLVEAFGYLVFYFHPDREITENLSTVTENILRRKLSCKRFDLSEMLLQEQNGQSLAGSITPSCLLG